MKKALSVSFCGLSAALITVMVLLAYIPYITYSAPAVAGLVLMVVLIELGLKHAVFTYLVSAVTVFLFCETEAKILYVLFFGVYPWLKCLIERIKNTVVCFAVKFLFFNAAAVLVYIAVSKLTGVNIFDTSLAGIYTAVLFLIAANVVFLLYDLCVSKMAVFYIMRFHATVSKILKK